MLPGLSDSGILDQSHLSDVISPSGLAEHYPVLSGIVVLSFLSELPVVVLDLTRGQAVPAMTVTTICHPYPLQPYRSPPCQLGPC